MGARRRGKAIAAHGDKEEPATRTRWSRSRTTSRSSSSDSESSTAARPAWERSGPFRRGSSDRAFTSERLRDHRGEDASSSPDESSLSSDAEEGIQGVARPLLSSSGRNSDASLRAPGDARGREERRNSRTKVSAPTCSREGPPERWPEYPSGPAPFKPSSTVHLQAASSAEASSPHRPFPSTRHSPPTLLPHKPKRPINVNFRFPTSFSSSGLPHYSRNQYLPLRLLDGNDQDTGRDEQDAAEQGRLSIVSRSSRHVEADGGDNVLFPSLLAFAAVLLPVLVICLVLGAIFTVVGLGL
ncbi:hypothetical protein DMC30DRAFT_405644 [Rhodotorula diobovata]|uniref:Uncharacterized protein n=1 Tax=Rhodotorula diobovata TaxID=5288 RepID=A0A5C5FL31_9BASI|nr:hypothetical protein DMC30DRAFT_405644 [Rhodotorula diobovata]